MATGKGWYVVWQGRKVGMVHATGKPVYKFHQGPYPTQAAAHVAGLKLVRKLNRKRNPAKRPRRTKRRAGLLKRMRAFGLGSGAGIVGRTAEVALDLTRAEIKAQRLGWVYDYLPEQERYEDVYGEPGNPNEEYVTVVLKDRNGNVLASLGFVESSDQRYLRQVRAELASEALHEGRHRMPVHGGQRRRNPALDRVTAIGPNMTEVVHGPLVILYSYETPVAILGPNGIYKTQKKWSQTTSKHIGKFFARHNLDGRGAMLLPQEVLWQAAMRGAVDA